MALTNLTDTKWQMLAEPNLAYAGTEATFYVNFKVNGKLFSSVSCIFTTVEEETVKTVYFDETPLYDGTEDFPAEYRVIEIIDGADVENENLIALLGLWATRIDITENLHVRRIEILDGAFDEIDFGSVKGLEFLVKNMTDAAINVAFDDTAASGYIVIPANTAQVVLTNLQYPRKAFSKIYVSGAGEGEVEVQVILW